MKKVIIISGGSDGVGRALAQKLKDKFQVIILSKNLEKTKKVAEEIGVDFVVADVSNYEAVEKAVAQIISKYNKIDILINNAGLWIEGKLENNEYENIQNVINVNTLGTIFLTKAVLPFMQKIKSGRIINVISQSGLYGKSERSIYHASKWAIVGFTKSLEMEISSQNISVSGFYPAGIKTGLFAKTDSKKDLSKYLEISEVVRSLEFIVETPEDVNIPEFGIKQLI